LISQKSKKLSIHLKDGRNMDFTFTLNSPCVPKPSEDFSFPAPISPNKKKPKSTLVDYNHFKPKRRSSVNTSSNISSNIQIESPVKAPSTDNIIVEEFKTPSDSKMNNAKDFLNFGTNSTKISPFSGPMSSTSKDKNNQFRISNFFATPRVPKHQINSFNTPTNKTKNLSLSSDKQNLKILNMKNNSKEQYNNIKYVICFSNLSNDI
jgi:hypothetical protein